MVAIVGVLACTDAGPPAILPPAGELVLAAAPPDGNYQEGRVGTILSQPLQVIVTRDGIPVPGVLVDWTTAGTGSEMQPGTVTTAGDGTASATWLMPRNSGPKFATASLRSTSTARLQFRALAHPDSPARMVADGGVGQVGTTGEPLPASLRVRMLDQYDNPVQGLAVQWEVRSGGGVVHPAISITDASGSAAARWTLGPLIGPQSLVVKTSSEGLGPFEVTATATAPPHAHVDVLVSNILFHPSVITVAPGTRVTWTMVATEVVPHSIRSGGSTTFPSSEILLGEGEYFSHIFTEQGEYSYDCAVHGSAMKGVVKVE